VQNFWGTTIQLPQDTNLASDDVTNCLTLIFPGAYRSCDYNEGSANFGGNLITGKTPTQQCPLGIKCNNICGLTKVSLAGIPASSNGDDCMNAGQLAYGVQQELQYIQSSGATNTAQLMATLVCMRYAGTGSGASGNLGTCISDLMPVFSTAPAPSPSPTSSAPSCQLLLNGQSRGLFSNTLAYFVGDQSTWTVSGIPAGSTLHWHGTADGTVDLTGQIYNDPAAFHGPFQSASAGHTYTRYILATDASGKTVCDTRTANGGQPLTVEILN
jgi:hypothetical protein